MGEIVNLRTVKKAKARAEAKLTAKENRVRHGRTGAAKANDRLEAARQSARVEGAAREDDGTGSAT